MKLPKTYENEVSLLNSSQPPSLTLSLSAADYAPLATEQTSASAASTHRISSSLEPRYSSRPKEDLLGVTGPSLQQSENNIHNQTSAYYSSQTIGPPSYTSKGIQLGPQSMDSNGAWETASPSPGLKLPPEPGALIYGEGLAGPLEALPYARMTEHRHGALDKQIGGTHYKDFPIQPIEFIHKNGIGFIAGNIIKYVCRYKAKGGTTDLLKAKHYIEMLLEQERQDP